MKMNPVEFCYFLQGYFELNNDSEGLSKEQTSIIKKQLDEVFTHEADNFKNKGELKLDLDKIKPNTGVFKPKYKPYTGIKPGDKIKC
jgi:hypothetical protein